MVATLYQPQLPWTPFAEDQRRFRRISAWIMALACTLAVVVPYVPLPTLEIEWQPELPPRVVRVLLGDTIPGRPVEEALSVLEPAAPESAPAEPIVAEAVAPEPVAPEPAPVAPAAPPAPPAAAVSSPRPEPRRAAPSVATPPSDRLKAEESGLLALQDTLAALRNRASSSPPAGPPALSSLAGADKAAAAQSALSLEDPDEAGSLAAAALAQPNPMAIARLEPRSLAPATGAPSSTRPAREASPRPTEREGVARTQEEIQEILDRNKGLIYALYNRELERDPSLRGRVILSITIAPSGSVTACRVTNTELEAPSFERELVRHVQAIDFGPKLEAAAVTTTVPIEFMPI